MGKRQSSLGIAWRGEHRRWLSAVTVATAVVLLLAGRPVLAASSQPELGQAAAGAATVGAGETADLGKVLVGPNGMTLYMFEKDKPGTSNCYGDCATKWPPLLVKDGETPVAGEGVTAKLGVTERTDGTYQVTAGDWPLYYWYKDAAVGDATGQAVGDVWWVMMPDGELNKTTVAQEAPAAAAAPAATEAMTATEAAATPAATEAAMATEAAPASSAWAVGAGENADLGKMLVGPNGMTLYMFEKDKPGTSNCYGDCATKWPPLLVKEGETPMAGEGVTAKLGVTERTDGTYQVTAGDWPLYYWYKDKAVGDATGQAVGDVWWVMMPDGELNKTVMAQQTPAAAAAAPAASEATPAATEAAAAAPAQLPVTGADGGLLPLAVAGLTLLAGGGWVALRRGKK